MVHKRRRGTAIVHTPNGILVVSEEGRTYHLPGGVARKGESRRKAAIRELREETGLIATDWSYLFEYTSFSNCHKVFLIKCKGSAEPKNEIKHLAYFDGSNVDVSDTTRKIIERYLEIKNSKFEYVGLPPSHTAEEGEKSMLKRCEVCGKEDDLPFVCNYCNKTFCAEHRLPESHSCISQPKIAPPYIRDKMPASRHKYRGNRKYRNYLVGTLKIIGFVFFIGFILLPNLTLYAYVETELRVEMNLPDYFLLLLAMATNPVIGFPFPLTRWTVIISLLQLLTIFSIPALVIQKIRRKTNKWHYLFALGICIANWFFLMRLLFLLEFLKSLFTGT